MILADFWQKNNNVFSKKCPSGKTAQFISPNVRWQVKKFLAAEMPCGKPQGISVQPPAAARHRNFFCKTRTHSSPWQATGDSACCLLNHMIKYNNNRFILQRIAHFRYNAVSGASIATLACTPPELYFTTSFITPASSIDRCQPIYQDETVSTSVSSIHRLCLSWLHSFPSRISSKHTKAAV